MAIKSVSEGLQEVKDLIEDESNWSENHSVDADGRPVAYNDAEATKFNLMDSLLRANSLSTFIAVQKAIYSVYGPISIKEVNRRGHSSVLSIIDKAVNDYSG